MPHSNYKTTVVVSLFVFCASSLSFGLALGQTSSLLNQRQEEIHGNQRALPYQGPTLRDTSWGYSPPLPPRKVEINDIIMIDVLISSEVTSDGALERRKTASLNAILSDWVFLEGLKALKPSPQSDGDPTVNGSLTEVYRAESDLQTTERISFQIAAYVSDIRPNGNLVLEAHQTVRINDEVWEYSLNGVCRSEDINPDNSLLSRNIAELNIHKRERGEVRDGYRRGWFLRWYDTLRPF